MIRRIGYTLLLCCSALLAQSDRGSITGRVLDPSQAAIAGAAVVVTNQETGIRATTATSETGSFTVPQLAVGRYEISIEAKGFRKYIRRDTDLNVAQTLTLNVNLEVGAVEQAVEVTAAAPMLESSTSDLGTVVNRDRVIDLPLAVSGNMRHPGAFVFLAPGVTGDTANTQINGSQNRAKEILIDGIGTTSPESGGLMFTAPPVESVSEFKLVSSNFAAEFGRTGAGFEVYTTRSGGNQFHGSVFEYFRNTVFDARGFIARTRAVNHQNEFGASIGGPVLLPKYNGRNRSFFHFVYDGFRYTAGALNELGTMPTTAMTQGNFAGVVRGSTPLVIYDPASTASDGAGGFTPNSFPRQPHPAKPLQHGREEHPAIRPSALKCKPAEQLPGHRRTDIQPRRLHHQGRPPVQRTQPLERLLLHQQSGFRRPRALPRRPQPRARRDPPLSLDPPQQRLHHLPDLD